MYTSLKYCSTTDGFLNIKEITIYLSPTEVLHFLLKHKDSEQFLCYQETDVHVDRRNFHGIDSNEHCISLPRFKELLIVFFETLKKKYDIQDFIMLCFDKISIDILSNILNEDILNSDKFNLYIVSLKSLLPLFNVPRSKSNYILERCWFHTLRYKTNIDCCSRSLLMESLIENRNVINYQLNWLSSKLSKHRKVKKVEFINGVNGMDFLYVSFYVKSFEKSRNVLQHIFRDFSKNLSDNLYLSVLKPLFVSNKS